MNRHTCWLVMCATVLGLVIGMLPWPAGSCLSARAGEPGAASPAEPFRSPSQVVVSPDSKTAYVTDTTAAQVVILDLVTRKKAGEIAVHSQPRGLCLTPDGRQLFVAERTAGTVAVIDTTKRQVTQRIPVPRRPVDVAVTAKDHRLLVAAEDTGKVWVFDISQQPAKLIRSIPAVREPCSVSVAPSTKRVVIANLLPDGVSTEPTMAAVVTVADAETLTPRANIKLPPGSTSVNDACVSPDGKWAYVIHSLGRFTMPITQLERGWVNTTALSILDLTTEKRLATVLLDTLTMGAADPTGIACAPDGKQVWITHAGTHEVSVVEVAKLHDLLRGKVPSDLAKLQDGSLPNIWVRIQKDPKLISELENDLTALYIAGAITRIPSGGSSPRGIAITPDGQQVLVANYFTGSVVVLDAGTRRKLGAIALGPQPPSTAERRGENIFHDATKAFQRWYSCATCHPNEGRVDGLSWDFLRDGIGNPKDTINLVHLDETAPYNRRATRPTARECARTGLRDGHMLVPTKEDVDDVLAFLVALRPEPSPYLKPDGKLSEAAVRGKNIFEGEGECAACHLGPYLTDQKMHDVGTRTPTDPDGRYDTPSLIEPYRTAPYMHDGRARTIMDVLTKHNPHDEHGKTQALSPQELADLEAYILSL